MKFSSVGWALLISLQSNEKKTKKQSFVRILTYDDSRIFYWEISFNFVLKISDWNCLKVYAPDFFLFRFSL